MDNSVPANIELNATEDKALGFIGKGVAVFDFPTDLLESSQWTQAIDRLVEIDFVTISDFFLETTDIGRSYLEAASARRGFAPIGPIGIDPVDPHSERRLYQLSHRGIKEIEARRSSQRLFSNKRPSQR